MLGSKDAMATIAVKDVKAAKKFYEGALGLKLADDGEPEAGMERVVQALKAKGVTFEHYDMPGMTREGDVHVGGNMKAAWFKDPDGNILALVSG